MPPVFHFDPQDATPGNLNYWGYSPISFFAPHAPFSSRQDPQGVLEEFRDMVKALHRAGIEVILDVDFNHTGEGNEHGPTLSFRGIANDAYYILENDRRHYANYSGCGNTLNGNHPVVRRMITDSLRYWVSEMHVDGFRFDLASILARDEEGNVLPNPPVLWDIETDPMLSVGVPMFLMGDECRHTQRGNNNAWCQDNETSWLDWSLLEKHADVHRFFKLLARRRLLRTTRHEDLRISLSRLLADADITWHGTRPGEPDWGDESRAFAFTAGLREGGIHFHAMMNASDKTLDFALPAGFGLWRMWINTANESTRDIVPWENAPRFPHKECRVAGLAVQVPFKHAGRHSVEFTEEWGQILNFSVFFLFGMIAGTMDGLLSPAPFLYAVLSLTLVRMLPVALALHGSEIDRSTVVFMGWFGPRGLASIMLGLVYLAKAAELPGEPVTRLAVTATVLLSIFAHGLSAMPGLRWISSKPPS